MAAPFGIDVVLHVEVDPDEWELAYGVDEASLTDDAVTHLGVTVDAAVREALNLIGAGATLRSSTATLSTTPMAQLAHIAESRPRAPRALRRIAGPDAMNAGARLEMHPQFLTEEMHMTTTSLVTAQQIRDQRVDERCRALRRIAEIVVSEAGYVKPGQEDFPDSVLQMIVPVLAGAGVQFPLVEFEVACDAIRQFQSFNSDERGWLEGGGLRTDDVTREQQHQLLEGAVESSLDRLMGRVH